MTTLPYPIGPLASRRAPDPSLAELVEELALISLELLEQLEAHRRELPRLLDRLVCPEPVQPLRLVMLESA